MKDKKLKDVLIATISKYDNLFIEEILKNGSCGKTDLLLMIKKDLEEMKNVCEERKRF